MRTQTHVTDTKAVKKVLNQLPDHWVVRELTERDYGIDLMVEIFIRGLEDKKGNEAFDSSGAIFHIQIKGTSNELKASKVGSINYSLDKDSLKYVEKFSVPFFLFRLNVSSDSNECYFVWIQRYIKDVLDTEDPFWRESAKKSITIRIPKENMVLERIERIEEIAFRPKYLEELIEYREFYGDLVHRFSAMLSGNYAKDERTISEITVHVRRIQRLSVLLSRNNCSVSHSSFDKLVNYIENAQVNINDFSDFSEKYNLDLLYESIEGMSLVEDFVLGNDGHTAY
ncbi:DUF4365 domain-containing protein [Saccharospirillum sp. HFRX-1]|uniref:DUF4365 domain-containing protein n=1 Tax=unclassified Saccharospirillum TaxID=2633430 RepID=UPI003713FB67